MGNITREEAITIIDNLHLIGCGRNQHECDIKTNEALDMAIEALSKQYMGCHGCRHYDSLQTPVICYDCARAYKDRYKD